MIREGRAPDIGVILRPGMAGQEGSTGHIGMTAGNGIPTQVGALVHIGVIAGNGVVKEPGIISRPEGQVVLALYKAAQSPGLDLAADVPQGADAVEEGVLLMGDLGDFIFLIGRHYHLLSYAASRNRSSCSSSCRNAASISENCWVRLNFSVALPGRACSSSILAHSSGWWS